MTNKRLGYFHKSRASNKLLVRLFEKNQLIRYASTGGDWTDSEFTSKLNQEEVRARKIISRLLRNGKVITSDDFFRAAHFFHHGTTIRDYALAVALYSISWQLGELWAKNYFAVAIDRLLLALHQPQYFGTQFEKINDKWDISPRHPEVTDKQRKEYMVDSMSRLKKMLKELDQFDKK
jgi:hypothetical protein